MTARTVPQTSVETFLELAMHHEGAAAVRLALDLLELGASTEDVIIDLLAAAQRESGERWLRNEWTVADEHAVSGIAQRSLDAVANSARPTSRAGSLVVACAEGDWHSLPAQMFAEMLRSQDFAVTFLGAPTPSDHVARLLVRDRPDALLVTCNLPLFFGGVTGLVDAAHRSGVPVIAGGRALGSGPARAHRLGADAWAPDVARAVKTIRQWADNRPSLQSDPTKTDPVAVRLDLDSPVMAAEAFESMVLSYPWMGALTPDQLARTREDLAMIVRFVAAAQRVGDPRVLTEFLDWLTALLAARSVPTTALVAGLETLAPLLDKASPAAGAMARDAVGRLAADGQAESAGPQVPV